METSADMTDISFADFETKTTEENECYEEDWRHLKLQKAENIFASDQTPTPTRLIKNCDEVGLFEDLNPFDLGFQRATEQNVSGTESRTEPVANDGDSLHTPQVYAVDPPPVAVASTAVNDTPNETSPLDVEQLLATTSVPAPLPLEGPPPLQLIQPQVITWVLPPQSLGITTEVPKISKSSSSASTNTIPAQTVRPYILPKPSSAPTAHKLPLPPLIAPNPPPPEPSSASLTPTSQLPIKERLKAIIHSNNTKRTFVPPPKAVRSKPHRDEDCMERRRAAATRYRNKMRNEHKELRLQNAQLQQENQELRDKIARLKENCSSRTRTTIWQCHLIPYKFLVQLYTWSLMFPK
ncbi:cyclic AMP-dependent transcription factor ATF-7 [Drosophila tropicalis]|uniref:cyclic AMP-dependent transcription factor ATF-7 n=1 Tax=Drosophila tropicalis TaxID=46794 RepID=UPI0035AB9EDE